MTKGDTYVINGGRELFGKAEIYGAKNAVLPMLAASLLTTEEVEIKNCPNITDIHNMLELLREVGADVYASGRKISVRGQARTYEISERIEKVMRSSMFMLGALVATLGEVKLSMPGGCKIGSRPLDIHLAGLERLGAVCCERDGIVTCHAKELVGNKILMRYPSVGATENLIMAAVLARGKTTLVNCAREPEIVSLAELLKRMGAHISGEGTSVIEIDGVKRLHGATITPCPDRIVAGTYLGALAVCGGEIILDGIRKREVEQTLFALGKSVETYDDGVFLRARSKGASKACEYGLKKIDNGGLYDLVACDLTTGPYPLFATDMQPIISAVKCFSPGVTRVKETVFENRFSHLLEMRKLGANVRVVGDEALLSRGDLHAGDMEAKDLRGGAALAIFAMGIAGESRVSGSKFVSRGYEDFAKSYQKLGVNIRLE